LYGLIHKVEGFVDSDVQSSIRLEGTRTSLMMFLASSNETKWKNYHGAIADATVSTKMLKIKHKLFINYVYNVIEISSIQTRAGRYCERQQSTSRMAQEISRCSAYSSANKVKSPEAGVLPRRLPAEAALVGVAARHGMQ